jgi:hypothetical protein
MLRSRDAADEPLLSPALPRVPATEPLERVRDRPGASAHAAW